MIKDLTFSPIDNPTSANNNKKYPNKLSNTFSVLTTCDVHMHYHEKEVKKRCNFEP